MNPNPPKITGLLLAAGRGKRFDPAGQQDKLLQALADGKLVAERSALNLKSVCERVVAVVRPGQQRLAQLLADAGCETTVCVDADHGMAASLQQGLRGAATDSGWLIALADMPFVQVRTLRALHESLQQGHQLVAPRFDGRRGNPVAIGSQYLDALLTLHGDQGARSLFDANPVHWVDVDDPGIHRDIDTPEDLR